MVPIWICAQASAASFPLKKIGDWMHHIAQEQIPFFLVLLPCPAYVFFWAMMLFVEQSIWNVWGHHLICQAQRWEEDLADNKLMKMSLTCTSISLFNMCSTEHINIVARKLLTLHLNCPRSGLLYHIILLAENWSSSIKGHQEKGWAFTFL